MGLGDFWLQSNNGKKISLENLKELKKSDLKGNNELIKLFDFFNTNKSNGSEEVLDKQELTSLFNTMSGAAKLKGNASIFEVDEAEDYINTTQTSEGQTLKQLGVKTSDLFNFISSLVPQKIDTNQSQVENGTKALEQSYTPEEIKDLSIQTVTDDVKKARQIFNSQNENQGVVSDFVNGTKETFDTEFASSRVNRFLMREELCADLLAKSKSKEGLSEKEYLEAKINLAVRMLPKLKKSSLKSSIIKNILSLGLYKGFGNKTRAEQERIAGEMEIELLKNALRKLKPENLTLFIQRVTTMPDAEFAEKAGQVVENMINQSLQEKIRDNQKPMSDTKQVIIKHQPTPGSIEYIEQHSKAYKKMTFEKTFEAERGVQYNQENIMDYAEKDAKMQFLLSMHNKREQIYNILHNATVTVDGNNKLGGADTRAITQNKEQLESAIIQALRNLYGDDIEKLQEGLNKLGISNLKIIQNGNDNDLLHPMKLVYDYGSNDNPNPLIKKMDLSGYDLVNIANKLQNYVDANYQNALGGKTLEEYGKEANSAYQMAYGARNSQRMAETFAESQQKGVQTVKTVVQTGGMVVMVAGQLVPVGGQVAAAMTIGGLATSTLGSVSVSALENFTKAGGATEEDKKEMLKELGVSLALVSSGMGIGKTSEAAFRALVIKNCPKLLAFASEVGIDATMSLVADYAITGQIDLSGEGIAQLQAVLVGILHAKGNFKSYLNTHAGNISTKPGDLTTKPQDASTKPQDVSTKPQDVSTKQQDVSTKQNELTAKSHNTTSKPQTDDIYSSIRQRAQRTLNKFVNTKASDNALSSNRLNLSQYQKNGIPLKYSRESFIKELDDFLSSLPADERAKIESEFGIKIVDTTYNSIGKEIEGIPMIPKDFVGTPNEQAIARLINKFTIENEVKIADSETKELLESILHTFPEFAMSVGKKQHSTHNYSVDVHTLRNLQDNLANPKYAKLDAESQLVLKYATILHDLGKRFLGDKNPDHGHSALSTQYARQILERLDISDNIKARILKQVENHHWFEKYNKGNQTQEEIANVVQTFGTIEDFTIAEIMAKSDYKNVNDNFHLNRSRSGVEGDGLMSDAEFDNFMETSFGKVEKAFNQKTNGASQPTKDFTIDDVKELFSDTNGELRSNGYTNTIFDEMPWDLRDYVKNNPRQAYQFAEMELGFSKNISDDVYSIITKVLNSNNGKYKQLLTDSSENALGMRNIDMLATVLMYAEHKGTLNTYINAIEKNPQIIDVVLPGIIGVKNEAQASAIINYKGSSNPINEPLSLIYSSSFAEKFPAKKAQRSFTRNPDIPDHINNLTSYLSEHPLQTDAVFYRAEQYNGVLGNLKFDLYDANGNVVKSGTNLSDELKNLVYEQRKKLAQSRGCSVDNITIDDVRAAGITITPENCPELQQILKSMKAQKASVTQERFTSTTLDISVATHWADAAPMDGGKGNPDGSIIYVYNCQKGTEAAFVNNYDVMSNGTEHKSAKTKAEYSDEIEILIQRSSVQTPINLEFRNGHWMITTDIQTNGNNLEKIRKDML